MTIDTPARPGRIRARSVPDTHTLDAFEAAAVERAWAADGPCRSHPRPHLWLSSDRVDRYVAQATCYVCPIVAECAARGAEEVYGTWGGEWRDRAPTAQIAPATHGSLPGYFAHLREGQMPCAPCARYYRQRQQRRNARGAA